MSETFKGPRNWEGLPIRWAKTPEGRVVMEAWSEGAWRSTPARMDKLFNAAFMSVEEGARFGIPASDFAPDRP